MTLTPDLLCVYCFNHPQAPGLTSSARFVINGQSVCMDHAVIAKNFTTYIDGRVEMLNNASKKAAA